MASRDPHLGPAALGDLCGGECASLARYAALAQESGLTPIVEPEVLMEATHALERCVEVTVSTLRSVYDQLARQGVVLEATLLKPNMVLPGQDCPVPVSDEVIADWTLTALRQVVPAAVPGLVFLSGGSRTRRQLPAWTR